MKKDLNRTGATLCSSMRPRSATTSWLNKFKLLAFAFMALLSINQVWGADTWTKLTSVPEVGDVVILVNETAKREMTGISTTSTKYGLATTYSTSPAGTYPLTVCAGNSTGSLAFKTSDNKYLYWTSGNSLDVNATLDNKTSWTATVSSGNFTITNVATNTRVIKYNKNSGSERFACYTSGQETIQLYKKASSKKTVNFSGQKSGHLQPSFLALSQIVIWGFFAFFCKKVFHIRCTKGARRMHVGSRPSNQPFFSPFGTLFVTPPFFLLNLSAACSHPRRGGDTDEAWCSRLTGKPYLGKRMWQLTFTNLLSRRCDGVTETIIQMVTTYVVWIGE